MHYWWRWEGRCSGLGKWLYSTALHSLCHLGQTYDVQNHSTFIQSPPTSHPSISPHQVLVVFRNAHWNDVRRENHRLVKPARAVFKTTLSLDRPHTSARPNRIQTSLDQIWGGTPLSGPSCLGKWMVRVLHRSDRTPPFWEAARRGWRWKKSWVFCGLLPSHSPLNAVGCSYGPVFTQ